MCLWWIIIDERDPWLQNLPLCPKTSPVCITINNNNLNRTANLDWLSVPTERTESQSSANLLTATHWSNLMIRLGVFLLIFEQYYACHSLSFTHCHTFCRDFLLSNNHQPQGRPTSSSTSTKRQQTPVGMIFFTLGWWVLKSHSFSQLPSSIFLSELLKIDVVKIQFNTWHPTLSRLLQSYRINHKLARTS